MEGKRISMAVIRRMPRYFRYVDELYQNGTARISSGALAAKMGLTASQVRQDFNCFGGFGQQGYGYNVENLRASIREILKLDNSHKAVLLGAGNLGRALMTNFNFAQSGFALTAAFDIKPELEGAQVAGVPVMAMSRLERYVAEENPDIAILTLPRHAAKEAADNLCRWGIRGIWNFTGVDLHLDGVAIPVENVHFSESLMTLSYLI
ncbi:MAG: redox-sensing transcriptional repressor Rex [Clostridiaceae bacterium]|jgi:redox-sensing transcriptional repressor|nr:redox-sensing transcriptional repressor Rex [Clostridiaceae bacterium]